MRVTAIKTNDNQNFNGIYMKKKSFNKQQIEIANMIRDTLTAQKNSDESLVSQYKKRGFDFIIKTVGDKLVSLDVVQKFSRIKWLFKKDYPDKDTNLINIYIYNKEAVEFLENDLKDKQPLLMCMETMESAINGLKSL